MCEILGVQMFENHRANAQDFSITSQNAGNMSATAVFDNGFEGLHDEIIVSFPYPSRGLEQDQIPAKYVKRPLN